MVVKKQGVISTEERKYIIEHMNDMTVEDIAEAIKKNPKVVDKEIKNYVQLPQAENNSIRWHLKKKLEWKHLKQEFTEEELNLIEDKYIRYIQQLQDDITATEEAQVLNMIKLEILMERNLKAQYRLTDDIDNLESLRQSILDKVDGEFALLEEKDRDTIMDIQKQSSSIRNADGVRNSTYMELQKELNNISSKLKASRDQRVGSILDPRFSFNTYVRSLLERDKQERESRYIQLYGMGINKEEARLSKAHLYADGAYDNPILTTEVLENLDKQDLQDLKEGENNESGTKS